FPRGLKIDLTYDMRQIQEGRSTTAQAQKNFRYAYGLHRGQIPASILDHHFLYNEVTTHLNSARYDGFKSSGNRGNIATNTLRENILVDYQQLLRGISDDENFGKGLQQKLLDFDIDNANIGKTDFLAIGKTQALLQLAAPNLGNTLYLYDTAVNK